MPTAFIYTQSPDVGNAAARSATVPPVGGVDTSGDGNVRCTVELVATHAPSIWNVPPVLTVESNPNPIPASHWLVTVTLVMPNGLLCGPYTVTPPWVSNVFVIVMGFAGSDGLVEPSTVSGPVPSPTASLPVASTLARLTPPGSVIETFVNDTAAHAPNGNSIAAVKTQTMVVSWRPLNGPHVLVVGSMIMP